MTPKDKIVVLALAVICFTAFVGTIYYSGKDGELHRICVAHNQTSCDMDMGCEWRDDACHGRYQAVVGYWAVTSLVSMLFVAIFAPSRGVASLVLSLWMSFISILFAMYTQQLVYVCVSICFLSAYAGLYYFEKRRKPGIRE